MRSSDFGSVVGLRGYSDGGFIEDTDASREAEEIRRARRAREHSYGRSRRMPEGQQTFLPEVVGRGALSMLSGAAKGAASASLGAPGDVESMIRGAYGAAAAPSGERLRGAIEGLGSDTILPSSESVAKRLTSMGWETNKGAGEFGEAVGGFLPVVGPVGALKAVLRMRRAAKLRRAGKQAQEAVESAEEIAPGFFKGGKVPDWDPMEEELDKIYINMTLDKE